jgi:hypothetical protein
MRFLPFAFIALCCPLLMAQQLKVSKIKTAWPVADGIELRGVAAGTFNSRYWERGKLHLVRDCRRPMLEPQPGEFHNIYAPSIVPTPKGWTVFYGGWDGAPTGNDRIYRTDTTDFIDFQNRRTVIEHGVFQHVCNVSATCADDGWVLMCTAYPDERGLNKPAAFFSKDGEQFEPATKERLITLDGYDKFAAADINGMNVLVRENGKYRLFFNNFRDFGKTFAASSDDGKHYKLDGVALEKSMIVNDVKRLNVGGDAWYLMGLHMNSDGLWYSVSRDRRKFPPVQTLVDNAGEEDRHIVAIGFVVRDDRVLGFLYGAGAAPTLDANKIFAVWLQKKVTINGKSGDCMAVGPDRLLWKTKPWLTGPLTLLAEDGETPLATVNVDLKPGCAYQLTLE